MNLMLDAYSQVLGLQMSGISEVGICVLIFSAPYIRSVSWRAFHTIHNHAYGAPPMYGVTYVLTHTQALRFVNYNVTRLRIENIIRELDEYLVCLVVAQSTRSIEGVCRYTQA